MTGPDSGPADHYIVINLSNEDALAERPAAREDGPRRPLEGVRGDHGESVLHREEDLYVADYEHGRDLQELIRARLLAERFSETDAAEWAFRRWSLWLGAGQTRRYNDGLDDRLCEVVVQAALAYRETGIPTDEAVAWVVRSINAEFAVHLRRCGWNPRTYSTLLRLCSQKPHSIGDSDRWTDSGIVWWRVLRYLRTGVRMEEAIDMETRRTHGKDIDTAIDVLIALRATPD